MRKLTFILSILCVLSVSLRTSSAPPQWFEVEYHAYVEVFDLDNNPVSGVAVKLTVDAVIGDEERYSVIRTCTGYTNSNGYVSLTCYIDYYDYPQMNCMFVDVIEPGYTHAIATGVYSTMSRTLYSDIWIMPIHADEDENSIPDIWEQELAEKFCPSFDLHHSTRWIAPEPVECMGVARDDIKVYVRNVYNGGIEADIPITNQNQFDPPLSSIYEWINRSNGNYSDAAVSLEYTGRPPGMARGYYYLSFHFDYPGVASTWSQNYQSERVANNFAHTIYAHFFQKDGYTVIQYWIFYPYNDGFNNHEGDWEHINVALDGSNPANSNIVFIDYYFHHKTCRRYPYEIEFDGSSTHPYIRVGGGDVYNESDASGASYPHLGWWRNVGSASYDEHVSGNGPNISYTEFLDGDFTDNTGIVILPERDKIDYNVHPEMSWFNVGFLFGEVNSDWPLVGLPAGGNDAPQGPAVRDSESIWNKLGHCDGYDYYPWYPGS
ncbi:Ig-like domain-containing protein [bacterium]|nr:Ig-like domain-containing protein [bacterium]